VSDVPEIDELLRATVPLRDIAARERARARLRVVMADDPRYRRPRRRRPWAYAAVAAAAVLAAILLGALLPPGRGGPALGAAAEIRQLGSLSRQQPTLDLGPDSFLYQRTEQQGQNAYEVIGGDSFRVDFTDTVELWIAPDGSAQIQRTFTAVSFPTDADRATWEKLGEPDIPRLGVAPLETYKPGAFPLYDVNALPTDTDKLKNVIESGNVIETYSDDAGLLNSIGALLAQGNVPPDVRVSLFDLAAGIPSVSVKADTVDPTGRAATAISVTVGQHVSTLFIDPDDASLVAEQTSHLPGVGDGPQGWVAYEQVAAVTAFGERP